MTHIPSDYRWPLINGIVYVEGDKYPRTSAGIIQAVQDALSGSKHIVLTEGEYVIDQVIQLNSDDGCDNIIIEGMGESTILKQADGANLNAMIYIYTANSVTIRNCCLDGNKNNQTGGAGHVIHDYEWTPNDNLTIENVKIQNARRRAIFSGSTNNLIIRNFKIFNSGERSIDIWADAKNWRIQNGYIYNSYDSGIHAMGTETAGIPMFFEISGVTIESVQKDQASGIHLFGVAHGKVIKNFSINHPNASHGVNGFFLAGSFLTITENTSWDVSGVGFEINSGFPHGPYPNMTKGCYIGHNIAQLHGSGSDANGIWAGGPESTYAFNKIYNATQYGIYATASCEGCSFVDNEVKNPQCLNGDYAALYLSPGISNVKVKENRLWDDQPTHTMKYGIRGRGITGYPGLVMDGNRVSGSVISDVQLV